MNTETVPTFIFKGETLVDVAYTTWAIGSLASYMVKGTSVVLSGDADRVVFELPYGCEELRYPLRRGETVNLRANPDKSNALPLHKCIRPSSRVEAERIIYQTRSLPAWETIN